VTAAAVGLRQAHGAGDADRGRACADALVVHADALLRALHGDPDHHPAARAELAAALGVYRNAAFAFRRLARSRARRPGDGRAPPLAATCLALLAQGDDHLRVHTRRVDDPRWAAQECPGG